MSLTPSSYKPEELEKVWALHISGLNRKAVAAASGFSPIQVMGILKKIRAEQPGKQDAHHQDRLSPFMVNVVRILVAQGMIQQEIGHRNRPKCE
jgi:hypothetical protein